jgi:hypothetical protein
MIPLRTLVYIKLNLLYNKKPPFETHNQVAVGSSPFGATSLSRSYNVKIVMLFYVPVWCQD